MISEAAGNSQSTILFADDNGQIQRMIAELLHRAGYRVIVASNGTKALQKSREFEGVIHLLLSDVAHAWNDRD